MKNRRLYIALFFVILAISLLVPFVPILVLTEWHKSWPWPSLPSGLTPHERFLYEEWAYDRGDFVSPDGKHRIHVRTHDAGATRDDYEHALTWVVEDRGRWSRRVVAKGYLRWTAEPAARDQIPLRWIDNDTFTIRFIAGPDAQNHPGGEVAVRLDNG